MYKNYNRIKKLNEESYFLRKLSKAIAEKLKDKDLKYIDDGKGFEGDLEFEL